MASNALETQKQENGSLMMFESFIERRKISTMKEIETVYPDVPSKWYATFEMQAKALKNYLGSEKGYLYSRDTGIMPFMEKLASSQMGVTTKDRWNPMDIVMVKRQAEKSVKQKMVSISKQNIDKTARLIMLNEYMKDLVERKILIGVSLKEVKKGVTKANVEEGNFGKTAAVDFKFKKDSLKCNLAMNSNGIFDTGELAMDFYAGGEEYHVQARSFRYSKNNTVVQTDITPKGRQSGAKLGKTSTKAMDTFLHPLNLQRPESPTQHRMIDVNGNFTDVQLKYWDSLYAKIKGNKVGKSKVNFGDNKEPVSELIKRASMNRQTRNVLGRLTSKLVTLEWINIYQQIEKKGEFTNWLSCLYYGAKKEFSDTNGPFIKVY